MERIMKQILTFWTIVSITITSLVVCDFERVEVAGETANITQEAAYKAIIAMKANYPEGMKWTNDNYYKWQGGYNSGGYGCVAFAFILSDAAFGKAKATKIEKDISISRLRVGDILRMNNDSHSVVVLKINEKNIEVAEGNYNNSIHWGRTISASEVAASTYFLTRYGDKIEQTTSEEANKPEETTKPEAPTKTEAPSKTEASNKPQELEKIQVDNQSDAVSQAEATDKSSCSDTITSITISRNIASNAYKGNTSLKSVTITGKVKKIGARAFSGCKKLKTIKIKSKKLTKKSVKNCLKGSYVKTVKVPKSKVKVYKKIFSKKNCGKKVKVVSL